MRNIDDSRNEFLRGHRAGLMRELDAAKSALAQANEEAVGASADIERITNQIAAFDGRFSRDVYLDRYVARSGAFSSLRVQITRKNYGRGPLGIYISTAPHVGLWLCWEVIWHPVRAWRYLFKISHEPPRVSAVERWLARDSGHAP